MNRRNFLKALGLGTSASALSACGLDNNIYYTPIEQILPYVVKSEIATPGVPTFFATSITRGPDAHPVLARHRDGRVIHVGTNRRAPFAPAVPKAALLELQKHYSPDRFMGPLEGGNDGSAVEWDAGLDRVKKAVQDAKDSGKKVAYLGGYRSGSMLKLIGEVCDHVVMWEPLGHEAEANAAELLFGSRFVPRYDLKGAHYVLSFGADLLGGWGGTRMQSDYAEARNPNHGHFVARYAHVSPYRDHSAANADDWYAVTPGSEVLVARAVASLVAKKKGITGALAQAIGTVDVAAAAQAAGIDAAAIEAIANQFAAGHAVALPGGVLGAGKAATDLAAASYLLNLAGGASPELFSRGGYQGPVSTTQDVLDLIAALNDGKVGVLFIDEANPVHALPASGAAAAIAKADLSVAFTSHPDETTAACKLILPAADAFEDWGDEEPHAGLTVLRQPSMGPLQVRYRPAGSDTRIERAWDVRSAGDVLAAVGRALGTVDAPTWRDFVQRRWGATFFAATLAAQGADETTEGVAAEAPSIAAHDAPGFGRWVNEQLATGFIQTAAAATRQPLTLSGSVQWASDTAPAGSGAYHLVIARHAHLDDGRYANQPWAQEHPDPMTGHVWDSWVEIHPDTAAKLGVEDNAEVEITTAAGSVKVGVEVTKSVRPDVVALQFGQGHTANGRYANGVGINAATLVGNAVDAHGAAAWQSQKADVKATGAKADLVSTFGGDTDEDRNFAVVVNAKQLAEHGDAPSDHPGEMTGIHHLQLDKRLVERGITDFYGLTEHPIYRFGMTVDTDACNGCGACSIACYAENNLPVVGKEKTRQRRQMSWIRVNRYFKGDEVHFVPMMCQHCGHAPCESVCPVLATYHNIDGLNAMIYNRCVGTRYCSNACPFSARKFNYHTYVWPEPFNMQLNPDVVTRTMGVMEKCSFCVQRIRSVKTAYKDASVHATDFNAVVPDEALRQLPACAEACPSQALTFGNLNDENSSIVKARKSGRNYMPLDDLNVMSAVNYLAKSSYHVAEKGHHGGGHGGDDGHGDGAHH